jgi:hypothetical protein
VLSKKDLKNEIALPILLIRRYPSRLHQVNTQPASAVRVHQGLVQLETAALKPWLTETLRLRRTQLKHRQASGMIKSRRMCVRPDQARFMEPIALGVMLNLFA